MRESRDKPTTFGAAILDNAICGLRVVLLRGDVRFQLARYRRDKWNCGSCDIDVPDNE